ELYVQLCEETDWSDFQLPSAKSTQFDARNSSGSTSSRDANPIINRGRHKPSSSGKAAMDSPHTTNPANSNGTPMADSKRPQHHPWNERPSREHQWKEFKDDLGELRAQLEAMQGQNVAQENGASLGSPPISTNCGMRLAGQRVKARNCVFNWPNCTMKWKSC